MQDDDAIRTKADLAAKFLSLTAVRVKLEQIDQCLKLILARIGHGRFERTITSLSLDRIYNVEPPAGSAHLFKVVSYSPAAAPDSSCIVTNLSDGWNSLSYLLAKEHKAYQVQVISTRQGVEFPQNRIEIWNNGESRRTVMAMKDGEKWMFLEKGSVQEFEDEGNYKRRKKKDRLTRDILIRYLEDIGFSITLPAFWLAAGSAIYYEERHK